MIKQLTDFIKLLISTVQLLILLIIPATIWYVYTNGWEIKDKIFDNIPGLESRLEIEDEAESMYQKAINKVVEARLMVNSSTNFVSCIIDLSWKAQGNKYNDNQFLNKWDRCTVKIIN